MDQNEADTVHLRRNPLRREDAHRKSRGSSEIMKPLAWAAIGGAIALATGLFPVLPERMCHRRNDVRVLQ